MQCIAAKTDDEDLAALNSLKDTWDNIPPRWMGSDPCGDNWEGIGCNNPRVISIILTSMGVAGTLSTDITILSELQILDLSYNKDLRGSLPSSIGDLKNLTSLILVGCSFSGQIPDSIGSLQQLVFLRINSNNFSGQIPPSIGRLSKLYWLDLADNQLTGPIPVSDEISSGLDMLVQTKHFHLEHNLLSGTIPNKLFSSNMELIHVFFEDNKLTGIIPSTLGLVLTLRVVRFDRNILSGSVPSNLDDLARVKTLFLSNNNLTGLMPDLTGMNLLSYLDLSNNTFNASDVPSWFSTLQSLNTLMMENTQLQGVVPSDLFSLSRLQTLYSSQLQLVDLQNNFITDFTERGAPDNVDFIYYVYLEAFLMQSFNLNQLPVDSVSLHNPRKNSLEYLEQPHLQGSEIFGPYVFIAHPYQNFSESNNSESSKPTSIGIIIGAAVGGFVILILLLVAGAYAYHRKRSAEIANQQNPSVHLEMNRSNGGIPDLKEARRFSFQELSECTNNFSEANIIGSGGFEKFVDVAMRCVEESGDARPTMNEVVKKIEKILLPADQNSNAGSPSS
ncbi:hypothetical protein Patl1_21597 [Pistacia atlantica]|uniref:Uncharacterized protein n=1 Tax=Pistacia atlantica TaxID=434234 RepID=A0ACC1BN01_9ROSI|nr:hypothetical protein Patl1_21597 [Pistacia atlantica]